VPSSPCRVTRIRGSKLFSLALTYILVSGCARAPSATASRWGVSARDPSGPSSEPPTRRPDGVVLEPPPAMPSVVERADTRGVIALREPLGGDALREVVLAVADAWQRESVEQLMALLTNDAGPLEARSRGRATLAETWRQRMHAHEYRRLAGMTLVRVERIERYRWEDLSTPDSPPRPPEMHTDELYVRVPLEVTRIAGERLFGQELLLLLRREEGKYKIAAYGESDGM